MTHQIEQYDHFFSVGDRVVEIEGRYKKMSLRDALLGSLTYRVVAVLDKHSFKIKMITK